MRYKAGVDYARRKKSKRSRQSAGEDQEKWNNDGARKRFGNQKIEDGKRLTTVFSSKYWKEAKAKVKFLAIYKNKDKYHVKTMCEFFGVSRSGYYDFVKQIDKPDKDTELGNLIAECQKTSRKTYGYRRVQIWLMKKGKAVNHKAVLRIMNKFGFLSEIRRRKKYKRMGDQLHRYENILNQNFETDRPNKKWVTDT